MNLLVTASIFLVSTSFSLTCNWGTKKVINGITTFSLTLPQTCDANDNHCGIIDYTYNGTYWNNLLSYQEHDQIYGCTNTSICTQLAGGSNQCTKVSYDYYQWYPTGACTNGEAQGQTFTYSYAVNYACCDTSNLCNSANYDYTTCTDNSNLQNYVTELNDCWYSEYKVFVNEMYCQSEAIYTYSLDCTSSGTWNSSYAEVDTSCYYQATCTDALIDILQDLADCACSAADTYGYDSASVEEYLSDYYSAWCSNVAVDCQGSKAYLVITYYYVKWTFVLSVAYSDVDDTLKANIYSSISTANKVSESQISLTFTDNSNGRRLLSTSTTTVAVTVTTQDQQSANTIQQSAQQNQATTYGGYNVTGTSNATTSSTSDTTSASNMFEVGIAAVVALLVVLLN